MRLNESNVVKDLKFKNEAREKLVSGINKLAEAVGSTLGPSGQCVLIEGDYGAPHITKDGVTVANSILLRDAVENLGVSLVKQAAKNTATKAGDGTTTSTVLAQAIIQAYDALGGDQFSFRGVKSGIEKFKKLVLDKIEDRAIDLNDEQLQNVATISANNDEALGELIANAFKSVGKDGVVTIEQSNTNETKVSVVEGTQISATSVHPLFYTNPEKELTELEKPLVFLSYSEIPNFLKIKDICEYAIRNNRPLLIISPLDNQVTSALARNKMNGAIKVNVVDPPSFGQKRKDLLEDLALLLGARVFDENLGDSIDSITPDMLGQAEKATSDIDGTVLVMDKKEEVDSKIEEIRELLENEDHPILKAHLEQRLGLLHGGVAVIKVGADTEVEFNEKLDRVDDAVYAFRAAKKEGILPGGGSALAYFAQDNWKMKLNQDELKGVDILQAALTAPYLKILNNAGLNPKDYKLRGFGYGVDATEGKVKHMIKAGIIDPAMVTKQALKNAVSVATTILSTDCVINNIRQDD